MADTIGELKVMITGDASGLQSAIASAAGELAGLKSSAGSFGSVSQGASSAAKSVDGLTSSTKSAGKATSSAAKTATADWTKAGKSIKEFGEGVDQATKPLQYISAGLAAGGVAAAKFAVDFEDNFARVEKTVEGTPEQLSAIRQGIIDLTTTGINGHNAIPQTTAELTELAAAGGQLGIQTENLLDFTETMAQLGSATNLSGEEGAATLARFMNVANVSQDQVRNLGSAVVDLGNNFATTESEIMNMALNMGSTGNVVGFTPQEILAYSTALSSLGVEAEAGGSAMSRIWMDMQTAVSTGGEDLAAFAEVSGQTSEEFAKQWETDAGGAFKNFLTGLSQSSDQVATLEELGFNNIRDLQALQRLGSTQGLELLTNALNRSNSAWQENTALQEEADRMSETTAGQLQITKNNLVEAGRSIGESFLPMIADASGSVKEFAQKIADMDDSGKKSLIDTAAGIIAVGAGTKVLSSGAKTIGNFVEGIGKIKTALSAGGTLASIGAVAAPAAAGIVAVTAAVVAGTAAYKAYKEAQRDTVKVTSEQTKAAQESVDAYNKLQAYKTQAGELETIIKTSTDTAEVDEAKQKLEELKAQVEEEYNLKITAETPDGTSGAIEDLMSKSKSELQKSRADLQSSLNASDFKSTIENQKNYKDQIDETTQAVDKYSAAQAKAEDTIASYEAKRDAVNKAYEKGSIQEAEYLQQRNDLAKEYAETLDGIYKDAGFDNKTAFSGGTGNQPLDLSSESNDANILTLASKLAVEKKNLQDLTEEYDRASGEVNEYKEGLQGVVDTTAALSAQQFADGEAGDALSGIKTALADVENYTDKLGFDDFASDLTGQLTLAQQGFSDISQTANISKESVQGFFSDYAQNAQSVGASNEQIAASFTSMGAQFVENGANIDNVVQGYVSASQAFGQSAEETAQEAALIQNGFRDMASAAATDGGLEAVAQDATALSEALGQPMTFEVNTSGDGIEAAKQFSETPTEDKTSTFNAEAGDDSGISAAEQFSNIPTEDKTSTVNIKQGDTSGLNLFEQLSSKAFGDGTTVTVQGNIEWGDTTSPDIPDITAQGTVNYDVGTVAQPENLTAQGTVNYAVGTVAQPANLTAQGTVNYSLGSAPTEAPAITGTANYSLGSAPTTAPGITGTATYTGSFPTSAPTIYGTVIYQAQIQGAATGTSDFSGGLAMINDEKGVSDPRELVSFGGKSYIFDGTDVVLPLPKHAKVYTAKQTKEMMSYRGIKHYASGSNNEDWENAKSDREHIRATSYRIIPAWEELEWLDEMKEKFADDAEVIKEIEEEVVSYTKEMWSEALDNEQYALDMGWQSEEDYYRNLAEYRDQNFAPDTQEYKDATLKLHKYAVQLIDDANDLSSSYIDLHGALNDWTEMGTTMGDVWQTVNRRNVQAANEGLITWEDYFDTREEYTEQFLDNYLDYSDDWIDEQKKYYNASAADNIESIKRQWAETDAYFDALGELTDEEYKVKISVDTEEQQKLWDALSDLMGEWEDDADWYEKQAKVYGFEAFGDTATAFDLRKISRYTEYANRDDISEAQRQEALRGADEARLDLYEDTEDYYDELLDLADDRIDEIEDLLDDQLDALRESWEVEDRAEDISDAESDLEKYKYAVTIEGQEKYEEAAEKLKELQRDEEEYRLEQENNALIEQLKADYEELEDEKAAALEKVRTVDVDIASYLAPLKNNMESNTSALIETIKDATEKIKPVTYTQNNTNYIYDGTDVQLFTNRVFNQALAALGG